MHPQLAAGALDDRRRLSVVVGVRVRADDEAHVLDPQADHVQRALEVAPSSRARACRCRRARCHRRPPPPTRCSAARRAKGAADAGARCRAARARPGRPRACGRAPVIARHLTRTVPAPARTRRNHDGHRRRPARRDRPRRARVLRGARAARERDAPVRCTRPTGWDTSTAVSARPPPRCARSSSRELFDAFPDWRFEVLDLVSEGDRARSALARDAGRSPARARSMGVEPNGASVDLEGMDVADRARRRDRREQRLHRRRRPRPPARPDARRRARPPRRGMAAALQRARARSVGRDRRPPSRSPTASGSCAAASRRKTMNVYLVRDGDGVMHVRRRHQSR